MSDVRFITQDPAHFHAALVQKTMYPNVDKRVHVYAPLGADLTAHLARIAAFNGRKDSPTSWELEIHAGPDFAERLLQEKPGNVVVLSGRNARKIDWIKAAVDQGLNVLADKPWIIKSADLPKLEAALHAADKKGLVALDIMTERFEITSRLQRELVADADVFGTPLPGTPTEPGVFMESVHYLLKMVAGAPLRRPAWYFDVRQQGEGLGDVGTHLVDLVPWVLFPDQALDCRKDVQMVSAQRKPTVLSKSDFRKITGEDSFPEYLAGNLKRGKLEYYCNTYATYVLKGVHVKLNVLWDLEQPAGAGDTHFASFRGSRARVEVRQTKDQNFRPEVYVVPNEPADKTAVLIAINRKVVLLQKDFPGVGAEDLGGEMRLTIPESYRIGHEAHFAQVTQAFLSYLKNRKLLPAWERPNMAAKYFVTTAGVELSREPVKPQ
jgi:predicted dehydrogenase